MPAGRDQGRMEGDRSLRSRNSPPIIHSHRHNLKSRFELIKTLGEGTYGKVKLAVELATGEKVAIKYIKKKKIHDDQDLNRIRREIQVMAKLQHPHIINVREVFENREKIIMVMDYASGGELYDYINSKKRLDDRDARRIFRQILSAVNYCHENGVVHRDLKLENIVLDDNGNVRIADFGLSNFYGKDNLLTTYCGSPLYASPEIVNGVPYHGPEVDCWSVGVLLYTLVYGAMPFDGSDFKTLKKQISTADFYEPTLSSDASGLIREILNPDPKTRATMFQIAHHWWVNVGYTTTPAGDVYEGPHSKTSHLHFSFLNFLSNGDSSRTNFDAKVKRSTSEDDRQSVASGEVVDSHVFSESENVKVRLHSMDSQSEDSDTLSSFSLDCEKFAIGKSERKKPARSILKKRGKFSGSDSGCGLDVATTPSSTPSSPCISDLSYELFDEQTEGAIDQPSESTESTVDSLHSKLTKDVIYSNDTETKDLSIAEDSTVKTPARRGILKRPKRTGVGSEEKRNSMGSQGSNSSSDLLDFSYDSAEGEQVVSKAYSTYKSTYNQSSCKTDNFRYQFQSMSISDQGMKRKDCSLGGVDLQEAHSVCRQALEICLLKGV